MNDLSNTAIALTDSHRRHFREIVATRQATRAFQDKPVPLETITEVLEDAQRAPSNANTQPWHVHIVSGAARDRLSASLLEAVYARQFSPDFSYSSDAYLGEYAQRAEEEGRLRHESLGIARDDQDGRMRAALDNYRFFNAPHVALLFMPTVGDSVRVAGDIGMYGQTFLLSLASKGLAGVPQTSVGMMAATVRQVLEVPDDMKLLFAISFGYPDEGKPKKPTPRVPVSDSVTFHD